MPASLRADKQLRTLMLLRTWGAQVISADLNWAVAELLQQLLLWQERAKATNHLPGAGFKRVVSGLRCSLAALGLGGSRGLGMLRGGKQGQLLEGATRAISYASAVFCMMVTAK